MSDETYCAMCGDEISEEESADHDGMCAECEYELELEHS